MGEETAVLPVVSLTRCEHSFSMAGHGKRARTVETRWTYFGVDAEGRERIYAEHTTAEENEAWRAVDPLWREGSAPRLGDYWMIRERATLC